VIYAHARNLTTDFFTNFLKMPLNVGLQVKYRKSESLIICTINKYCDKFPGNKFATGSRINVLTAHAQTLSPQKSPEMVSRARNDCLYRKTGALNSNMTSDFKPEVVM